MDYFRELFAEKYTFCHQKSKSTVWNCEPNVTREEVDLKTSDILKK